MYVVDANVLLYATNRSSAQHEPAVRWLDDTLSGTDSVGLPWHVLLAFLRISTRAGIFPTPLGPSESLDIVAAWLGQPNAVHVSPTLRHFDILRGLIEGVGTAANLTSDAHLAALAIEYGAILVSFDRDFQRFAGLKTLVPG